MKIIKCLCLVSMGLILSGFSPKIMRSAKKTVPVLKVPRFNFSVWIIYLLGFPDTGAV